MKTTRSAAEVAAARNYLEQAGYAVLEGEIQASTAYGIAHDAGRTLTETPSPTLNARAEKVAQSVVDRLIAVTAAKQEAS